MSLPFEPSPSTKPLPPGPWRDEQPTPIEFTIGDFSCVIMRIRDMGHLCGYIFLPEEHPAFPARSVLENELKCHGGITYNRAAKGGQWFGFNCAHAGDLVPAYFNGTGRWHAPGDTYRDLSFVRAELESLAAQLSTIATSPRVQDLLAIHNALKALAPTLNDPNLATNLLTYL